MHFDFVGWRQVAVCTREHGLSLELDEKSVVERPPPSDLGDVGTRVPLPSAARRWLAEARTVAECVLVFDYTATNAQLVERSPDGAVRAYAGHERVEPLARPGSCDITHDVPIELLEPPRSATAQADWLRAHGIMERVETARTTWHERAHIGDLEALFARSAVTESEALLDPSGLGGFTVIEWS